MTTKCPHCFATLTEAFRIYSCRGGCEPVPDRWFSAWSGQERRSHPFTVIEHPPGRPAPAGPSMVGCRICGGPTQEVCPTCHYPLPDGWRKGTATCVALAGARYTGKSVYVGVLRHALEAMVQPVGGSVTSATDETRRRFANEYERPLLEARGLLPATPAGGHQRGPLIFGLGRIRGVQRYLVLRDVAGEDLENYQGQESLHFFRNASLVLFLFDPTRVPEVRRRLADHLQIEATGGDPLEVLATVLRVIGDAQPLLAVALSKFDTLQSLGSAALRAEHQPVGADWARIMAHRGAAFNRDVTDSAVFDVGDADLLHAEVRSLLQSLYATNLVNTVDQGGLAQTRYFAVSALGAHPDHHELHAHGVAPFRVVDPIRWVLAHEGVLEARTG